MFAALRLGAIAVPMSIREQADSGKPTVVADPDGPIAAIYRDIARKVAARIARAAPGLSANQCIAIVEMTAP